MSSVASELEQQVLAPPGIELLATHDSDWAPHACSVTLNVTLDACIVPTSSGEARLDTAHVVVLDDFFGEPEREELLSFITQPGWDHSGGPPEDQWERATADAAYGASATWGLKGEVLKRLAQSDLRAKLEVQSRLCKLYPEAMIAHMPSAMLQNREVEDEDDAGRPATAVCEGEAAQPGRHGHGDDEDAAPSGASGLGQQRGQQEQQQGGASEPGVQAPALRGGAGAGAGMAPPAPAVAAAAHGGHADCSSMLANAATAGDSYSWHVDADPWTLPLSRWTDTYGHYFNRERGKPLFVSLLLYLDREWGRDLDAETIFLDTPSDTGLLVRPKAYRAVLLDQDVLHRLSPPAAKAGSRPRYSLVWKLVFIPRHAGQALSLARPEWGPPCAFGSAAKAQALMRQLRRGGAQAGGAGQDGQEAVGSKPENISQAKKPRLGES